MNGLNWDEYFIKIAETTALRSPCLSRSVGAVIVDNDNRILSTGYNGPPAGLSHCLMGDCYRSTSKTGDNLSECRAVHAEQNAIMYALKCFSSIKNTKIYVTTQPCTTCCKLIIVSGITKVVYSKAYTNNLGLNMLKEAGVEVLQVFAHKAAAHETN